jgi:hypothetical protein
MPGVLSQKLEAAFVAFHNTLKPQQIDLTKGLRVRVRVLESGHRQMFAWREKKNPSELEVKTLARDAGFTCPQVEHSRRNGYTITDMPEVAALEVEAAKEARDARASNERTAMVERVIHIMLTHFKTHPDNIKPYSELWREGLEIVPTGVLEARLKTPVGEWWPK